MTTATDGTHLLHAILDDPDADDRRLVYADWLEDEGQCERAALVRLQTSGEVPPARFVVRADEPRRGYYPVCYGFEGGRPSASMPWVDHMRRAMVGSDDWVKTLPDWLAEGMDVTFSRGFVEEVRCTLDAWREHGPALVRAHPVRRVELTDRDVVPELDDSVELLHPDADCPRTGRVWFCPAKEWRHCTHFWPLDFFPELAGPEHKGPYTVGSRSAAFDLLSRRAILWAKGQ